MIEAESDFVGDAMGVDRTVLVMGKSDRRTQML